MTRAYLMRFLRKEDRDSRNRMRFIPAGARSSFETGYNLGRAHAASELLTRLQREPRKAKK